MAIGILKVYDLSTFLGLRNSLLYFLKFLSSRLLLSYKPLSYEKRVDYQLSDKYMQTVQQNIPTVWPLANHMHLSNLAFCHLFIYEKVLRRIFH